MMVACVQAPSRVIVAEFTGVISWCLNRDLGIAVLNMQLTLIIPSSLFNNVTLNTELVNTEPLPLGEIWG